MSRLQANVFLLVAAALWGFGNVAQKTVLDYLDPFSAVGLRCLIAALVVLPWARLRADARPAGYWTSLIRVAVLFCTAIALQQSAYLEASVTNASFLVNTATVMTPVAAWLLLGERPTFVLAIAAGATLAGIMLLVGELNSASRGDLIALLSAAFYALWMVELGRHMRRHGDAPTAACVQFLLAAAVTLPIGAASGGMSLQGAAGAASELLILGVFSTAIAFGLQTLAQQFTAASHAAVIVSGESVFGAMGAAIFLGERLSATATVGAAVVLAAIMLIAFHTSEPAPHPKPLHVH
jgi:drug/metabolite transporter (DMT)-like permease